MTTSEVTDITIEAALRLINKLGQLLEERAKSLKNDKKRKSQIETNEKIFGAFKSYLSNPDKSPVSLRLKLLIKHMFEHKESGWIRNKLDEKENESII